MDEPRASQKAYLLHRLHAAKGHSLGRSKLKPSKAHEQRLGLDAGAVDGVLDEFVVAGHVEKKGSGARVSYRLTDAGVAHVGTLPPPPPAPAKKPRAPRQPRQPRQAKAPKPPPPPPPDLPEDPNLLPFQQAYLLLQLLAAKDRTLTAGTANKLPKVATADLELSKALADQLRRKMAEQGYLTSDKQGRSVHLTLTDAGLRYLATLRHHPAAKFTATGDALNHLLDAAREAHAAPAGRAESRSADTVRMPADDEPTAAPAAASPPADLSRAAYEAFRDLLRERFGRDRLVPIFEVRRQIAQKYGADAARHEVLDDRILQLWRDGRVRIISISDLRQAKPDELADSIRNNYETLFYLEAADGNSGNR